MQEHLSEEQIVRYRAGALSAHERLALALHLSQCGDCRQRPYEPEEGQAVALSLPGSVLEESAHLTYEEKKAFIHNESDALDREMVESHVAVCSQCGAELESFRRFAARMDAHPELVPVPKKSLLERTLATLELATWKWVGAVAAALVIAVSASVIFVSISKPALSPPVAYERQPEPPQPEAHPQPDGPPRSGEPPKVSPPKPASPNPAASVATINLSTGEKNFAVSQHASRLRFEVEEGPYEKKPPPDPNVVQRVANEGNSYARYKATLLRRADGKTFDLGVAKVSRSGKVAFTLAVAGALADGDYQLTLGGVTEEGKVESAGSFSFQIVKK